MTTSKPKTLKQLLEPFFGELTTKAILTITKEWLEQKRQKAEAELKEVLKTNPRFRTHLNGEIYAINELLEELKGEQK